MSERLGCLWPTLFGLGGKRQLLMYKRIWKSLQIDLQEGLVRFLLFSFPRLKMIARSLQGSSQTDGRNPTAGFQSPMTLRATEDIIKIWLRVSELGILRIGAQIIATECRNCENERQAPIYTGLLGVGSVGLLAGCAT
jgi:hypothetical protein